MLTLTKTAAEQIQKLKTQSNDASPYLRVAVLGGGCEGNTYRMAFENTLYDGDKQFESQGVTMVVDSQSMTMISGVTIDFTNGLDGSYFTFNNPNAHHSCGCGKSFS